MIWKSGNGFSEGSCSNKELERDNDSVQKHRALAGQEAKDSVAA
jgi:hypothetical protein